MPRKAFKCSVELDIYTVTCPGTRHLTDRNMLYLLVRILGEARRTKSVFATFPLSYNERLYFERTFTNAREPAHVVEILEDENVLFELVQFSDVYKGGKVLARYEQSAREFLYPTPTLTGKAGMEREVLLGRTVHFSGIDPKLEFSSTSTIQETTVPGSSTKLRSLSRPNTIQSDSEESDGTSETEEEIIVTPRAKHDQLSRNEMHCICECPRRPENRGRVKVRSRSLSPSHWARSASPTRKPPFRAGKADESIISRRRFLNSGRSRSRHRVVVIPEGEPLPCPNCRTPHRDCIVCQAYYKVYGKDFLSYRFSHHERHPRATSTPMSEPPQPRFPPPEDEPLYQSRAYSAPLPMSRRIFPPGNAKDHAGSFLSSSTSDEIHERVERIMQKHSPQPQYSRSYEYLSDSDDDSLLSLQELRTEINEARMDSLDRSFEDPERPTLGTRLDRSVTVPLSDKTYWSNRKSQFTGRSHRAVLEESMGELYSDLYKKAARTFVRS